MNGLLASVDTPPSGRTRPIWCDASDYGRATLLAGAEVPWRSPTELGAFFGRLQSLFRSDAILVDVADLLATRVRGDERLRAAMAAGTRCGFALRALLADEPVRATAVTAIQAVASTKGTVPLVLSVPSPARWLAVSARWGAPGSAPAGPDATAAAAVFAADFLRIFAGIGVDGLLLDDGPASPGGPALPLEYRPVLRVGDDYGWPLLVRTDAVAAWPHGSFPGVAAWLGSAAPAHPYGPWGLVAGADFWNGAEPPAAAGFLHVAVPVAADPETVIKRIGASA